MSDILIRGMEMLNGVKASLIHQAIGVQGKGLKRKPWTGYESIKR